MIVRLQSFLPLIPKLQSSIVNRSLGPLAMVTYNLVLSAELIMKIGHNRELLKLTFRALAFRVSNERRRRTINNKQAHEQRITRRDEQTDEQTNRRTNEQTSTRTNEQTNKRTNEHTNKRAHEQTNKRTDEQTSTRTNEQTHRRIDVQTSTRTNEQTDKRSHLVKDCTSKASSSRDQLFA